MNVFVYFQNKLGVYPKELTLRDLPISSACGRDCKRTIDAAAEFIASLDDGNPAEKREIAEIAERACVIFWIG